MSRNSSFAESLAELISEQVTSVIDDYDFSDKVKEEMPDIEDMVEKAVDNLDIDDKVRDTVDDAVENYEFSDIVGKEVEKELEANLHEYVENEFDSFAKGDKFKELVLVEVNRVLEARDAAAKLVADAKRAKLVDYVKFGPLRRWLNW